MEGSGAPVQGAVLRPFYGSPGVYQDHGAHLVGSAQEGHPPSPVSRRLTSPSRVATEGIIFGTDSASAVCTFRSAHQ